MKQNETVLISHHVIASDSVAISARSGLFTHLLFPAMAAEASVLFLDEKNQKLSVAIERRQASCVKGSERIL